MRRAPVIPFERRESLIPTTGRGDFPARKSACFAHESATLHRFPSGIPRVPCELGTIHLEGAAFVCTQHKKSAPVQERACPAGKTAAGGRSVPQMWYMSIQSGVTLAKLRRGSCHGAENLPGRKLDPKRSARWAVLLICCGLPGVERYRWGCRKGCRWNNQQSGTAARPRRCVSSRGRHTLGSAGKVQIVPP